MKFSNKITLIFTALFTVVAFESCTRCQECSYKQTTNGITTTREQCGSDAQIDQFKADIIKEAKAFGVLEKDVLCREK